jgi:signal transduction histidine kinase
MSGVIGVAVDVTERVAALRTAEAAARLRSDFVASVSHELRTPLTAIVGYAELLQARWTDLAEAQKLEHISRIVISANRQKRMVDDLLLLSRIEEGDLRPEQGRVPIGQAVARASDEVRSSYQGQQIDLDGPADLVAFGDVERVVQVMVNLIDNAAKYSSEGSPIAVTWGEEGSHAVVRVRDQGPGIPASGRNQLFTRFGRVPGSRTRAGRVGTGLGLHLGRQIVVAMGSSLDLEDTGPAGSVFCLQLLAAKGAGPSARGRQYVPAGGSSRC